MLRKRKQLSKIDRLKQVNSRLKNENKKLRKKFTKQLKEIKKLKDENVNLQERIGELERIIFGKKKKDDNNSGRNLGFFGKEKKCKLREKNSYQREKPLSNEITEIKEYPLNDKCPNCDSYLINMQWVERFIEDIVIDAVDKLCEKYQKHKKVIQQRIEKGYCPKCRKWHSTIPIAKHEVSIGDNVRMFIPYATYALQLSYSQTQNILLDLYGLKISRGEITNILNKVSQKLNPAYERLKKRIRQGSSIHEDETGWQTGAEKNYSWVMASGESEEAVFLIGRSRGKANAEELQGDFNGVRVTDDYPAYKNLPGEHQKCWSHIIRRAKELWQNEKVSAKDRETAKQIYMSLLKIHEKIQGEFAREFNHEKRNKMYIELGKKIKNVARIILVSNSNLKKLNNLGKALTRDYNLYLTCLLHEGVVADNNKAERKLRHLVLKRKNCFGTKTKRANKFFEINFSVLMSLWWNDRDAFWSRFSCLLQ